MRIVISPFSSRLPDGKQNAKNYPWWKEVVAALKEQGHYVIQIGVEGEESIGADEFIKNAPLYILEQIARGCDARISVDNFFQHLCAKLQVPCVVIFGKSDPKIFGYTIHTNLLKDKTLLRANQFDVWFNEPFDENVFVAPTSVVQAVINQH